jgi:hypothetical protein
MIKTEKKLMPNISAALAAGTNALRWNLAVLQTVVGPVSANRQDQ